MNVETKPHLSPSVPWGEGAELSSAAGVSLQPAGLGRQRGALAARRGAGPRRSCGSSAEPRGQRGSPDPGAGGTAEVSGCPALRPRLRDGSALRSAGGCSVLLRRRCIQNTSPSRRGRWCCSSQEGEVGLVCPTAEWEMWYLVAFVGVSSKLTLNILRFKKKLNHLPLCLMKKPAFQGFPSVRTRLQSRSL